MAEYPDHVRIAQTILDQQKTINEQKARIAELEGISAAHPADQPDSDIAWNELWTVQYDLWRELDDKIAKLSDGRSLAWGAALHTYLIEHLVEQLRMCLRLPESDASAPEPEGAAGNG